MHFFSARSVELPPALRESLARYRYEVFVQRLGWALPARCNREQDEFDRGDTLQVLAQDDAGSLVGCGRLLPCNAPYMLETVFPHLLDGRAPPRCAGTWELSRFAATVPTGGAAPAGRLHAAERLLLHILRLCQALDARTLLAVSTLAVERLLRRTGLDMSRLGPPRLVGHAAAVGVEIRVNTITLSALARYETAAPATRSIPASPHEPPRWSCCMPPSSRQHN